MIVQAVPIGIVIGIHAIASVVVGRTGHISLLESVAINGFRKGWQRRSSWLGGGLPSNAKKVSGVLHADECAFLEN